MLVHWKKIMPECNIMIFAAGQGIRLLPYTSTTAKPVISLLQVPIGYYLLPYLQKLSASQLVINTFHLPEQIHQLYKDCQPSLGFADKLSFSDEANYIKGSAGGLKQAEDLLQGDLPIVACNADEVLFTKDDNFILKALQEHIDKKSFATLVVTKNPLAGTKFGAIWVDDQGKVIGIGKTSPRHGATPWHYVGVQILSNRVIDFIMPTIETNIFYDVLVHLLEEKQIETYPIDCDWYETGNIADYSEAKKQISQKLEVDSTYQKQFEQLKQFAKLSGQKISDLA